ncbi:hypothetical protein ABFX02_10G121200 [Erythranthe guttata]
MSDIPSELYHNIFRRLTADSLLRFRTVCKEWRRLIDDPSFIRSHTNNQHSSATLLIRNLDGTRLHSLSLDSINYNNYAHQVIDVSPVKTVYRAAVPRAHLLPAASCNGLILLSHSDVKKIWAIWNPLTRQFYKLPKFINTTKSCLITTGLGYDSASDDYKVMSVDELLGHRKTVYQTSVYSLKSDTWRIIKDCKCHYYSMKPGVFLNGALHWHSWHIITVFVFRTETYDLMRHPYGTGPGEPSRMHLDALGGCLVVSYYYTMDRLDVWVMKEYGVHESWVKLFLFRELGSIGFMECLRPIAYFKTKGQFFMQHGEDFFWFDVEKNSAKKVTIRGLYFSSQSLPGSLFRLDESCSVAGKSTSEMKRKRNKTDASVKHSVRITDDWSRSDSTPETSWSSSGDD